MEQALAFQAAALGQIQTNLHQLSREEDCHIAAETGASLLPAVQEPRLSPPERWPLVDLVTRLDRIYQERQQGYHWGPSHTNPGPRVSWSASLEPPEPTQLGKTRRAPEEREDQFRQNLWWFRTPSSGVSSKRSGLSVEVGVLLSRTITGTTPSRPIVHAVLSVGSYDIKVPVFVDSGSDACFMDPAFIQRYEIPLYY